MPYRNVVALSFYVVGLSSFAVEIDSTPVSRSSIAEVGLMIV